MTDPPEVFMFIIIIITSLHNYHYIVVAVCAQYSFLCIICVTPHNHPTEFRRPPARPPVGMKPSETLKLRSLV